MLIESNSNNFTNKSKTQSKSIISTYNKQNNNTNKFMSVYVDQGLKDNLVSFDQQSIQKNKPFGETSSPFISNMGDSRLPSLVKI